MGKPLNKKQLFDAVFQGKLYGECLKAVVAELSPDEENASEPVSEQGNATVINPSVKPRSNTEKKRRPRGWWKSTLLPKLEAEAEAAMKAGRRCPSRRDLATRFDCSTALVQKCFANSEELNEWQGQNAMWEKAAESSPMLSNREINEAMKEIEKSVPPEKRQELRKDIETMDKLRLASLLQAYR